MSHWQWRAPKQSQVRPSNQLFLSFPPFPVRHPGAGHGKSFFGMDCKETGNDLIVDFKGSSTRSRLVIQYVRYVTYVVHSVPPHADNEDVGSAGRRQHVSNRPRERHPRHLRKRAARRDGGRVH